MRHGSKPGSEIKETGDGQAATAPAEPDASPEKQEETVVAEAEIDIEKPAEAGDANAQTV